MITKSAKLLLSVACCAVLSACGGLPANNEMQLDKEANGRFSGIAGSDFTPQQIKMHVEIDACPGGTMVDFSVRVLPSEPDYKIFSGRCDGEVGAVANPTGAMVPVQTAPVQTVPVQTVPLTTAGNSAGWDGSTPFVD